MKLGKYLIGLISGLLFGMFFAPKKGEDLRKEMKNKWSSSDDYQEGINSLKKAFHSAGKDAWRELKNLKEHEQVSSFLDLSQERMKAFLKAAQDQGGDAMDQVQGRVEMLATMVHEKLKTDETSSKKPKKKTVKKPLNKKKAISKKATSKTKKAVKKPVVKKGASSKKTSTKKKTVKKPVAKMK